MKKQLERISPEKAGISSRQVKKCIEALMHDHAEGVYRMLVETIWT